MPAPTTKPRSPDENTEKRQRLLDVSLKLFAERGFDAVGMREIAAEAEVSLGLIRIHFGSKDGLRQELDAFVLRELASMYEGIAELGEAAGLEGLADDIVAFIERDRDVMLYLRTALLQKNQGSLAMMQEIRDITRRYIDTCEAQGNLQPDVDKEQAALMMFFDLLGPLILEPFSHQLYGASMYDASMVAARNKMLSRMLTRGFLVK
ncbi:TetR/AcrR family transcriptional regulator [Pseudomaricurvus alkylphenolicus]|uniref:TetR/AcrR family transcriptional regulator n=1 Tax=Pseudomaricurvus alkylphenolicus TaxID=1306991 RepID=UPI00141E828C|nr:TetR/AcrR family transcriptional regulator [Pseudomaricurvus alkylphenolicus]NIB41600.1 TetR/AcrR family transcriptional regulator [Pseudomaricurvus alkylphenolicus]